MPACQQKVYHLVRQQLPPDRDRYGAFGKTDRSQAEILGHQQVTRMDMVRYVQIDRLVRAVYLNDRDFRGGFNMMVVRCDHDDVGRISGRNIDDLALDRAGICIDKNLVAAYGITPPSRARKS